MAAGSLFCTVLILFDKGKVEALEALGGADGNSSLDGAFQRGDRPVFKCASKRPCAGRQGLGVIVCNPSLLHCERHDAAIAMPPQRGRHLLAIFLRQD